MYSINLIRYALTNQCGDSVIYKIQKIKEYYLEVLQNNVFLYNFKNKDEACQYLIDHIILKSLDDVQRLHKNDKELIKIVLENKALFDENINVFADIKEKAKSFKYTVFDFETIEDYKAALEEFVMNDGTESAISADKSDETSSEGVVPSFTDGAAYRGENPPSPFVIAYGERWKMDGEDEIPEGCWKLLKTVDFRPTVLHTIKFDEDKEVLKKWFALNGDTKNYTYFLHKDDLWFKLSPINNKFDF